MFLKSSLVPKAAAIIIFCTFVQYSTGHGRLIEPPSRGSAWRYGFQTPPNYNDHELYCGGFARQWNKNEGKCGICGDPWDTPTPRPHEFGGKWGQGVIVRKYNSEAEVTFRVELTANHIGYFEFRLCPEANAQQDCLDKHILKVIGGSPMALEPPKIETRFYPRNGSRIYDIKVQLPSGFKCEHCLLQWRYVAGNNWGTCSDGTGGVGCGPQEEFRACADISIGVTGRTTMRPFRPGVKTTTISTATSTDSETTESGTAEEPPEPTPYIAPIIIIFSLLFVICILAAIYLYTYHGQRVKQILRWRFSKEPTAAPADAKSEDQPDVVSSKDGPVPPPRTKRLSQVKDISPEEPSIVIGESSPGAKTT